MAPVNKGSSVQRTHPLLYWMTIAYIVGLPNFLQFDITGRTHEFGLFNVSSIGRIALTLLTAYVLVINLTLGRGPIFPRKVKTSSGPWISLLAWCTLATILQPASRLSPSLPTDLPLGLFRLGEWVLAFVLFLVLYTREPAEDATALVVELIGRCSWIIIFMVWLALPFFPHLAYGSDENGSPAILGGVLLGAGILPFESCIAFFYSLFFARSVHLRWSGCLLALITLGMARSRTCIISLAVTFLCYAVFLPRRPAHRWPAIGSFFALGALALAFSGGVAAYFARGQSVADLASLDGRTYVWQASMAAVRSRPLLGYGFLLGAKKAIKDHWIYTHWLPPNAHSEFVESLLVGGIPACGIVLYIYFSILWRSVKTACRGPLQAFLTLALLQVVIHSLFAGEDLMTSFTSEGAVFLLCWIAFSDSVQPLSEAANLRWRSLRAPALEAA